MAHRDDPADRSRHRRGYSPRRAAQSCRDRGASVLAYIRSAHCDPKAYVDRSTADFYTCRANQHTNDRQHTHTHASTNAHRNTLSNSQRVADKHSDTWTNFDRDAVAHRDLTTAAAQHTHAHADTRHACADNADAYFDPNHSAGDNGILYADRHTDTHLNANGYTDADKHANGYTYSHRHGYSDFDGNINAVAHEHTAAVLGQHATRRTEHRLTEWNRCRGSMRRLYQHRFGQSTHHFTSRL